MQIGFDLSLAGYQPNLLQRIRQLFTHGEQGVWYDPSDFSTMFQDASGTTPVTGVGQPVGLILDKSKGLVLGAKLVTNGGFDSDVSGWATGLGVIGWVAGRLRATNNSGVTNNIRPWQAITTVIGLSYEVLGHAFVGTAGAPLTLSVGNGAGSTTIASSAATVVDASLRVIFTAQQTTQYVWVGANLPNTKYFDFDNISVREIPGNHASQVTSTKRPLLQQDGNGKHYLAFDGIDDALSTASIDFTGTDKMTVVAGVRKLSDAANGIVCELGGGASFATTSFTLNAPPGAVNAYSVSNYATSTFVGATVSNYTAPITNVLTAQLDNSKLSAALQTVLRVNGLLPSNSVSGTLNADINYLNTNLYIGMRSGTGIPFNGNLYSLLIRGALSTDAQIAAAETWANSKTGAY